MHSPEELLEAFEQALAGLDLDRQPEQLYEPVRYGLGVSGKRIRPLLALLACEMFGGKPEQVMSQACGIEVFHNFTLVHDDIMDKALLRRGQASVHHKWNNNIAILSGDTMFALACKLMSTGAEKSLPAIMKTFTDTAIEVCEGQQYDMNFETSQGVTLGEYIRMIRLKTAVLLGCSLKIGALTAGGPEEEADKIYRVGEKLGIAFQIRDDLLDSFGDEASFGKKVGGDILCNKKTFLYLAAMESGNLTAAEELLRLYTIPPEDNEAKIKRVKEIYIITGVRETAESTIERYYDEALALFDQIMIVPGKKTILRNFALSLMHREF